MTPPTPVDPSRADLQNLYDRLYSTYGPQHWWPGDGPFEVIVGAILTQNTNWTNVEKALDALREAGVWSFEAIHGTERDLLAGLIRPSGYFNQKARKLQEFASIVENRFGGDLARFLSQPTAELRAMLLDIWGIGEETADDIVLYAADNPSFVIDTYTRRIVDRIGWSVKGKRYSDYQSFFTEHLPLDAALFNEFHALLDEHAATVCRPTPKCADCCLREICATGAPNTVGKSES